MWLLLIETRFVSTHYCLIGEIDDQVELPWYHDIHRFLSYGTYPESATTKDRRALRQLATIFVICGESLYRRSLDGMLLLCIDRATVDRVMREVHVGVCKPHMGSHMKDHEDWLLLVDYGDKLLPVCVKVSRVSRCTKTLYMCHHLIYICSHPLGHFQYRALM